MLITLTDHAIDRYHQRIVPHLTRSQARAHLSMQTVSARLDGDVYASAKRAVLPDCVLVVKDNGGYRYVALTCLVRPDAAPDPVVVETPDDFMLLLRRVADRAGWSAPVLLGEAVETMPTTELREHHRRLVAEQTIELAHRADLAMWLRDTRIDEGERLTLLAARTACSGRLSLLGAALAEIAPVERRRAREEGGTLDRAVIEAAFRQPDPSPELRAALDTLAAGSKKWAEYAVLQAPAK